MGVKDSTSVIYRVEPEPAHAREDEVPRGYKRTEVGVIPEDWEMAKLPDVAWFQEGPGVRNYQFTTSGVKLFNGTNIEDGRINLDTTDRYISENEAHGVYKHFLADAGDIVIACSGVTIEKFDGKVGVVSHEDLPLCMNTSTMRFKVNHGLVNKDYFRHFLKSQTFKDQIGGTATGSAQLNFGPAHVRMIDVPLASSSEQKAITEALGDTDALIESLQQLITKKRTVKQGAMQALLTGRQRLPGFIGEWQAKRIGDALTIQHGKSQRDVVDENGPYPILATGGQIGWASAFLYDKPSVLIGRKGTIDEPRFIATPFWSVDTLFYSVVREPNVALFLFYRFMLIDWQRYNEASGVPSLNAHTVENIELLLPAAEEQTAIAAVLSDLDAEIEALEARLAKTRALKAGMMQVLLTGRIRLVEPKATHEVKKVGSQASKGHSKAFNEAVVIAALAKHFGSKRFPLGRKRYTKLAYLLHRHATESMDDYLKKAAGPYNPKTRYGGAERLALEQGYVQEHRHDQYIGFVAGNDAAKAEEYFLKWYGSGALQWLEQFRRRTNDELELLATADMAAGELRNAGKTVSVESVKKLVRNHSEWEAKLDRAIFSDANIAAAIDESRELFTPQD